MATGAGGAVFAATVNGLYVSHDDGLHWSTVRAVANQPVIQVAAALQRAAELQSRSLDRRAEDDGRIEIGLTADEAARDVCAAAGLDDGVHFFQRAGEYRLDAAVAAVANPALDAALERLAFDEGAGADYVPLLFGASGGGTIDAPLVFAGWGVSPASFPPQHTSVFSTGDFGTLVVGWEDDYAKVDVRGKVVLVFRIANIQQGLGRPVTPAPTADTLMQSAIKRGAAAILWVDASRAQIIERGQPDPYRRLVADDPLTTAAGVPIFMLTPEAADRILAPVGIKATAILRGQLQGDSAATPGSSMARELPERAHVELPIAPVASSSHSLVALTPAPAGAHRLVIWAVAPSLATGSRSAGDALSALVRALAGRAMPPLVFVVFDPRGDPVANAKAVRATLGTTPIDDVLAIESLGGSRLRFATVYCDVVPAIDDYAARAGAAALRTAGALNPDAPETGDLMIAAGLSAFVNDHWILISGQGPVSDADDLRADAAAVLAYAVARYAAAAPELVR